MWTSTGPRSDSTGTAVSGSGQWFDGTRSESPAGSLTRCAARPTSARAAALASRVWATPIADAIAPQLMLPAVMAPLKTVRYTANDLPRTQLGRIDCATPFSVVNAVIHAAPSTSKAPAAAHSGGDHASAPMTAAVTNAAANNKPSALRY